MAGMRKLRGWVCLAAALGSGAAFGQGSILLPTGQTITPQAAPGAIFTPLNPGLPDHPTYDAGQAVRTALSPDGNTLLILTSGYNRLNYSSGVDAGQPEPFASNEYVFVYDVSGTHRRAPVQKQVLLIPNSFCGLVWAPDGTHFYVSGGVSDAVFAFANSGGIWGPSATIPLGHTSYARNLTGNGTQLAPFLGNGIGILQAAEAAGLAITPDGTRLLVTNIGNDSLSLIDTTSNTVLWEYDLRPYANTPSLSGTPGGEAPFSVAIGGNAQRGYFAYVSSIRDREVDLFPLRDIPPDTGTVFRIPLRGTPNSLALSPDGGRLYVAQDNYDRIAIIETQHDTVVAQLPVLGSFSGHGGLTGAAPNGLAVSRDGNFLYVTDGGVNAVSVIALNGSGALATTGLIPTGWYPHSASVSADGSTLYVVNGKSVPGPNPMYRNNAANQYILQLEQAGFLTLPVPSGSALASLTATVAANNNFAFRESAADHQIIAALRRKIKHVIYVIKENRTFDQVLGDLGNGSNGDAALTEYGAAITPNLHALAGGFVTLDNFYDSGEVSGNGWPWSTEARESDFGVKTIPPNYANRGFQNDSEGLNRLINVALDQAGREASYPTISGIGNLYDVLGNAFPGGVANLLPGLADDFATDGPVGTPPGQGYIWDQALRAGLSVRNYGFFIDLVRYNIPTGIGGIPLTQNPAAIGEQVAWSANPTLAPFTDIYYRGFDNAFPDTWREQEWAREFAQYVSAGNLPALSLVRLMHDHTGSFSTAAAGINTPDLQQADNDYAVGALVQAVAASPYAANTLIFVVEDDAQDGADHVDAHRSTAYVIGPYVKQKAIVSDRYTTVNMVRTIEEILGTGFLNLNDVTQGPMSDVFDLNQTSWSFTAMPSTILQGTGLFPNGARMHFASGPRVYPTHSASWWAAKTKGFDWSSEDRIPADRYNRILWEGLKGGAPYPNK